MDLRGIECRITRLERAAGRRDPEAEAVVREAFKRAWARHGAAIGPVLERFERTGRLDLSPEEERELDALWDALHEEAKRIASARGVPWDRVLRQLTI